MVKKCKSNLILQSLHYKEIISFDSSLTENSVNLWNMKSKMQIFLFPSQLGETNALFGDGEITVLSTWMFATAIFLKYLEILDHQCYILEQWFSTRGEFDSKGISVNVWR